MYHYPVWLWNGGAKGLKHPVVRLFTVVAFSDKGLNMVLVILRADLKGSKSIN